MRASSPPPPIVELTTDADFLTGAGSSDEEISDNDAPTRSKSRRVSWSKGVTPQKLVMATTTTATATATTQPARRKPKPTPLQIDEYDDALVEDESRLIDSVWLPPATPVSTARTRSEGLKRRASVVLHRMDSEVSGLENIRRRASSRIQETLQQLPARSHHHRGAAAVAGAAAKPKVDEAYSLKNAGAKIAADVLASLAAKAFKKRFYRRLRILDDIVSSLVVASIFVAGAICQSTYRAFTGPVFSDTGKLPDHFTDPATVIVLKALASAITAALIALLGTRMFIMHQLRVVDFREPPLSSPHGCLFPCSCVRGERCCSLLTTPCVRNVARCRGWTGRPVFYRTLVELLVVVPHVPPGVCFSVETSVKLWDSGGAPEILTYDLHVNLASLIVLVRCFMLLRTIRNHAGYRDPRTQYVGRLNGVKTGTIMFTLKLLLKNHPGVTIIIVTGTNILATSLLLWFAEKFSPRGIEYYEQSLWCTVVTMSTVGYGDLYPISTVGRIIIAIGGILGGLMLSALLTTVFVDFLNLTKQESTVIDIVERNRWFVKTRNMAVRILQAAWRVYFARSALVETMTRSRLAIASQRGMRGIAWARTPDELRSTDPEVWTALVDCTSPPPQLSDKVRAGSDDRGEAGKLRSLVAFELHENWRAARPRLRGGNFESCVRVVDGAEYDMANLTLAELPPSLRTMNRAAASVACTQIEVAMATGAPPRFLRTLQFVERCAAALHRAWTMLSVANPEMANHIDSALLVEYCLIPHAEQEKTRAIVRIAVATYLRHLRPRGGGGQSRPRPISRNFGKKGAPGWARGKREPEGGSTDDDDDDASKLVDDDEDVGAEALSVSPGGTSSRNTGAMNMNVQEQVLMFRQEVHVQERRM